MDKVQTMSMNGRTRYKTMSMNGGQQTLPTNEWWTKVHWYRAGIWLALANYFYPNYVTMITNNENENKMQQK